MSGQNNHNNNTRQDQHQQLHPSDNSTGLFLRSSQASFSSTTPLTSTTANRSTRSASSSSSILSPISVKDQFPSMAPKQTTATSKQSTSTLQNVDGISSSSAIVNFADQQPPTVVTTSPTGSSKKHEITFKSSLWALATTNLWFNIMALIFTPLGIISYLLKWGDIPTFVLNMLAIIPLAKVLDFSTDQLSMRVGETIGGLLNASFGNAVELIVGVLALKEGLLRVVQASLIGSILSNLLLVMGFCFFLGGLIPFEKNRFQRFDVDNAGLSAGLLAVVVLAFIVPAALGNQVGGPESDNVLHVSRGAAIILLITYVQFLLFQLYTNPEGLTNEAKARRKIKRE
ncbi:hypothetical protein HDU76_010723, partial [Blyttiomyces sp. JEL0837]